MRDFYLDNQWGYINQAGQVVIDPIFKRAYAFADGLALVRLGTRLQYIDNYGKTVWQFDE